MKIMSVVGARPNFVKMFPIIKEIEKTAHENILVHTGQHYDINMSDIFFKEMNVQEPNYNLGVGSNTHGYQTAEILKKIEDVIIKEEPDVIITPGDTNTTLGAALAGVKLHYTIAHLEAGLRSFDKRMPEEINRILTDNCSDLLFCPTKTAITNLKNEGITKGVHYVGDTMFEIAKLVEDKIEYHKPKIDLPKEFVLSTIHRAENTTDEVLPRIIDGLINIELDIVIPLHPRTRKKAKELGLLTKLEENLHIIEPVSYYEFTYLLKKSNAIITDSGGIQKEAYWNKIPCVTVRDTTEWIETIEAGGNVLANPNEIKSKLEQMMNNKIKFDDNLYGFIDTSNRIIKILERTIEK